MQATPAEVPDYDDNSVAPFNPNAPIVEVTKMLYLHILVICGRNKTAITNSSQVVETPVIVPEGDIATLRIRVSGNPT